MPASQFTLTPPAPYSLARTTERYARFEEAVDRVVDGAYARLVFAGGAPVRVRVAQEGSAARPVLRVDLAGPGAETDAGREAARVHLERALGTSSDLRPCYRALRDDPVIGAALRDFRGLRVAGFGCAFEACVTAILTQQVNLSFAFSIRAELARAFGRRARIDRETWIAFPTPERVARETPTGLRRFRLSQAKAEAIHRVATAFATGELADEALRAMPDDEVVERLTALRGIGRWTAETVLIRGLGRLDAFPAADLGIVKYLAQGLLGRRKRATESQMREFAERWRPYRSVALVYAYAELARRRAS